MAAACGRAINIKLDRGMEDVRLTFPWRHQIVSRVDMRRKRMLALRPSFLHRSLPRAAAAQAVAGALPGGRILQRSFPVLPLRRSLCWPCWRNLRGHRGRCHRRRLEPGWPRHPDQARGLGSRALHAIRTDYLPGGYAQPLRHGAEPPSYASVVVPRKHLSASPLYCRQRSRTSTWPAASLGPSSFGAARGRPPVHEHQPHRPPRGRPQTLGRRESWETARCRWGRPSRGASSASPTSTRT